MHDQFGTDPMHHFGVTRVNGCASGLLKYRQFSERRPVTHVTRAELSPVRCTPRTGLSKRLRASTNRAKSREGASAAECRKRRGERRSLGTPVR